MIKYLIIDDEYIAHDIIKGYCDLLPNMQLMENCYDALEAIEYLDARVIRPIYKGLKASGEDFRMLVLPDHPTPLRLRTHVGDPVPYLLYDSTNELDLTKIYDSYKSKYNAVIIVNQLDYKFL